MIIDVHAHVYISPKIFSRFGTKPFLSAEQQISIMDSKGVDKAVILPLNNAEAPAEHQSIGEVLSICEKYPGRFIPFCNIDPRLPARPDLICADMFLKLLQQYKNLGCKGLGEMACRVFWNDPSLLALLEACSIVGFPVLFHTTTPDNNSYGVLDFMNLPYLEFVLKKFPNLKLIGHSQAFWSEISGDLKWEDKNSYPLGKVMPGGAIIRLLRDYPNLYADISAGSGLNALSRDPEHAWSFIDEFQDRLLLGMDYCAIDNDMQHIEWLTDAHNRGKITPSAYNKITSGNASRILNLFSN